MDQAGATELLIRLKKGEDGIYDRLYPLIYEKLRQLAHAQMSRQEPDHTLSKTELVHETYIKMIDQTKSILMIKATFLPSPPAVCGKFLSTMPERNTPKNAGEKERQNIYT